jgi:HEAT repeat protein
VGRIVVPMSGGPVHGDEPDAGVGTRRRRVIVAGHEADQAVVLAHLDDPDPGVRAAALSAAARCGALTADRLTAALRADPSPFVRRRAAELAATRPDVPLLAALADPDATVVEMAAWASGEREPAEAGAVAALAGVCRAAEDPLVREAAAAALGAIGDPAGLPAILHACNDRLNVRRRAVLALAPFDGPEVRAALADAAADRDWQVRQAAEDLLAIISGEHP